MTGIGLLSISDMVQLDGDYRHVMLCDYVRALDGGRRERPALMQVNSQFSSRYIKAVHIVSLPTTYNWEFSLFSFPIYFDIS